MDLAQFRAAHSRKDMSLQVLLSLLENRYESEFHDFKQDLQLTDAISIAELAKDVAAFYNCEGGYIIIGVTDKTFQRVGFPAAAQIESKTINDKLTKYVGECIRVTYAHHLVDGTPFGLILIPKRDSVPVLMLKDSPQKNGKYIFRKNDVCLRCEDESKVISDLTRIKSLFSTGASQADSSGGITYHSEPLKKLIKPDWKVFVGREAYKHTLMEALSFDERAWIISINGIGGVGKTALATWASWECHTRGMYDVIISVSAKRTELTRTGIKHIAPTLVSYDNLLNEIAEVMGYPFSEETPLEQKEKEVTELLSLGKTLLVIDNFETIEDDRIGDFLRGLKGETKALVTTRKRLGKGEFQLTLREMDDQECQRYIYHQASEMAVDPIFACSDEEVQKLIEVSGKLPLAMKWLVGQVKIHGDVGTALTEMQKLGTKGGAILEFCFRGIFRVLSPQAQNLLCCMPIFHKAPSYEELKFSSGLPYPELDSALEQLKDISLISESDDSSDDPQGGPRYNILPLTLFFAQKELSRRQGLEEVARKRLADYYHLQSASSAAQRQYQALLGPSSNQKERQAVWFSQMATSAYHKGDYDEAVRLYKRALEVHPKSHEVLLSWALVERQEGNIGRAEELFEQASKTGKGARDPKVWRFWGLMLKDMHDWKGAAEKLEVAAKLHPGDVKTLHQLGFCLSRAQHYKLADEYYDRILNMRPPVSKEQQIFVYTAKAQNYFKWGQLVDSLQAWEKVLELDPGNAQAIHEKQRVEEALYAKRQRKLNRR